MAALEVLRRDDDDDDDDGGSNDNWGDYEQNDEEDQEEDQEEDPNEMDDDMDESATDLDETMGDETSQPQTSTHKVTLKVDVDDALKILVHNAIKEFGFAPRDVYRGVLDLPSARKARP